MGCDLHKTPSPTGSSIVIHHLATAHRLKFTALNITKLKDNMSIFSGRIIGILQLWVQRSTRKCFIKIIVKSFFKIFPYVFLNSLHLSWSKKEEHSHLMVNNFNLCLRHCIFKAVNAKFKSVLFKLQLSGLRNAVSALLSNTFLFSFCQSFNALKKSLIHLRNAFSTAWWQFLRSQWTFLVTCLILNAANDFDRFFQGKTPIISIPQSCLY